MTDWLSPREQHTWRAFLRMHRELQACLARQLTESGISPADFEVLVNLTDTPERRLRVTELATTMRWERSRLSHQLTRMEKRGLLAREDCEADARGAFVVLTDAGMAAIEAAASGHVATVRLRLFDLLSPEEVGTLGEISDRVLKGLAHSDVLESRDSEGTGVANATTCSSLSGM